MRLYLYSTIVGLFLCFQANCEILFEGYYKVLADKVHAGFLVQRYEFDPKAKRFTTAYFIKTGALAGNLQESLKAVSNEKFQPISFQYTSQTGGKIKLIDATFAKNLMTGSISDGNQKAKLKKSIPKGVFLSSFLGYLMLQNGYKVGKKFTYSAIAEENAEIVNGEAFLKSEEKMGDHQVFRILNRFKGSEFVSYVTSKGEIITTDSLSQKISTELVAKPEEATVGQMVPNKTLITLFGKIPEGKENPVAKKTDSAAKPTTQAPVAPQPKPDAPAVTPASEPSPAPGP